MLSAIYTEAVQINAREYRVLGGGLMFGARGARSYHAHTGAQVTIKPMTKRTRR